MKSKTMAFDMSLTVKELDKKVRQGWTIDKFVHKDNIILLRREEINMTDEDKKPEGEETKPQGEEGSTDSSDSTFKGAMQRNDFEGDTGTELVSRMIELQDEIEKAISKAKLSYPMILGCIEFIRCKLEQARIESQSSIEEKTKGGF